jgi:O-antigen/teichoic acid export membrane protein
MFFKQKLGDLFTLGAAGIFSSLILSLFWLFLASFLEKTEYGELGFLLSVVNVASTIALLGLRNTIIVYEAKEENIFPASFWVGIISSLITAIVVFILTENVNASILTIGMVIFAIGLSGLNGKQEYRTFSLHKLIRSIVTVTTAIIFYQFFEINGILLAYFISTLIIIKEIYPQLKNNKIKFSVLKTKFRFLIVAYSTRLSQVFFNWGDKVVIGILFGFTFLGSYHFAFQYLLLLESLPRAVSQYLLPQESKGNKNKKIKIIAVLISFLITIISILVIPYGVNSFIPKYVESILPMQILSISIIPLAILEIQNAEFIGKEKTKIVLVGSIIQSVIYLVLIMLLGSEFGLIGFATGYLIAVMARLAVNIFAKKAK